MMHKTDAAIQLIRNALTAGIKAGYVLMDTWFTTEPMLKNILEWIRRNQNDQKSYGELFFMYCEDIQDMDLTNALQSLMALFVGTYINAFCRYHIYTEK